MKFFVLLIALIPSLTFAKYVPGDGTLDLVCSDTNPKAAPYNQFELVAFWDDEAEVVDPTKGDGSMIYRVTALQTPFLGAEIVVNPQPINGCQEAPLQLLVDEENPEGPISLYFECDGDGDAGLGEIVFDPELGTIEGQIGFPEGSPDLFYPVIEDTEIAVSCDFKN